MKKIVMIIVMLSAVLIGTAQNYKTAPIHDPAIKSHQIMQTGAAYQGTVYEPFSTETPSDQQYSSAQAPRPRRTPIYTDDDEEGWVEKPDHGRTDLSPLGDAVLPLLLCALAFGFVIARRRKHAE